MFLLRNCGQIFAAASSRLPTSIASFFALLLTIIIMIIIIVNNHHHLHNHHNWSTKITMISSPPYSREPTWSCGHPHRHYYHYEQLPPSSSLPPLRSSSKNFSIACSRLSSALPVSFSLFFFFPLSILGRFLTFNQAINTIMIYVHNHHPNHHHIHCSTPIGYTSMKSQMKRSHPSSFSWGSQLGIKPCTLLLTLGDHY